MRNIIERLALSVILLAVLQHSVLSDTGVPKTKPVAATINIPETFDDAAPPHLTAVEQKLFESLESAQYVQAKKVIQSDLHQSQDKSQRLELLNLLAYVDFQLKQDKSALKDLQNLIDAGDVSGTTTSNRSHAVALEHRGYVYLRMRKTAPAIEQFKAALTLMQGADPTDPIRIGLLEPIVGCLLQNDEYSAAQPFSEQLVSVCETRAKSGDLNEIGSSFWSEIQLLQIYKNTNNVELHKKLIAKPVPLLDQLLVMRMKREGQNLQEDEVAAEKLRKQMLSTYIAVKKPTTLSEYM